MPEPKQRPAREDDGLALNLEPFCNGVCRSRQLLGGNRDQVSGNAISFVSSFTDIAREGRDSARPSPPFIDLANEITRPRDTIVCEHAFGQLCLFAAAIGRAEHSPQRKPAEPVATPLISQDVSPAAGTRAAPIRVPAIGD